MSGKEFHIGMRFDNTVGVINKSKINEVEVPVNELMRFEKNPVKKGECNLEVILSKQEAMKLAAVLLV